jgi:hypothetical protein
MKLVSNDVTTLEVARLSAVPYPSLVDFAATWSPEAGVRPAWAHGAADPLAFLDPVRLRPQLEDLLDTIVAVQRAEWLHDGVYAGPRTLPEAYRDLLECSRTLEIPVPPAIISGTGLRAQATYGTDARAFLHLSSYFLQGATLEERRFLIGRLCGHVAARHVTWTTTYALLVDQGGFRQIAAKALGPALDVLLAPLSLGARLALSHAHRVSEITADRAGLLCASEDPALAIDGALRALLRLSLGVRADVDPQAWLAQIKSAQSEGSPGRLAELVASTPWMHKRWRALEAFSKSEVYAACERNVAEPRIDRKTLDAETESAVAVG